MTAQTDGPTTLLAESNASVERMERERRRRARRRLGALGGILILGLALGSIYATGFAGTGGATGTAAAGASVPSTPGANEDTDALDGLVSSSGNLNWDWSGRWGSVASQSMYTVDLDTLSQANNYFLSVLLTTVPTGFADLQLQLRIKDDGNGGACTPGDMDNTNVPLATDRRRMTFTSADAQVTFAGMGGATSGLPGGNTYCVGVFDYAGSGLDTTGTFIRKSGSAPYAGTYPAFTATLDRM